MVKRPDIWKDHPATITTMVHRLIDFYVINNQKIKSRKQRTKKILQVFKHL